MRIYYFFAILLIINPAHGSTLSFGPHQFSINTYSNTEIYRSESDKGFHLIVTLRLPEQIAAPNDEKIVIQATHINKGGFTEGIQDTLEKMSAGSAAALGAKTQVTPKKLELKGVPIYRSTFCNTKKVQGRCTTVIYVVEKNNPIQNFIFITIFTKTTTPPSNEEIIERLNFFDFIPPDF